MSISCRSHNNPICACAISARVQAAPVADVIELDEDSNDNDVIVLSSSSTAEKIAERREEERRRAQETCERDRATIAKNLRKRRRNVAEGAAKKPKAADD